MKDIHLLELNVLTGTLILQSRYANPERFFFSETKMLQVEKDYQVDTKFYLCAQYKAPYFVDF